MPSTRPKYYWHLFDLNNPRLQCFEIKASKGMKEKGLDLDALVRHWIFSVHMLCSSMNLDVCVLCFPVCFNILIVNIRCDQ